MNAFLIMLPFLIGCAAAVYLAIPVLARRRRAKREAYTETVNRYIYGDGSPGVVSVASVSELERKIEGLRSSCRERGVGASRRIMANVAPAHHERVDIYHHGTFSDTPCDDAAAGFVAGMAITEALSCGTEITSESFSGGGGDFGGGGASGSYDDSSSCGGGSSGGWGDSGSSDSGCSSD